MATKPVLRNLLLNRTKIDFVLALTVAVGAAFSYKFFVSWPRRAAFDEAKRTIDVKVLSERMKAKGVFEGGVPMFPGLDDSSE